MCEPRGCTDLPGGYEAMGSVNQISFQTIKVPVSPSLGVKAPWRVGSGYCVIPSRGKEGEISGLAD